MMISLAALFFAACEKDSNEVNPSTGQNDYSSNTNVAKVRVSRPFQIQFSTAVDPNPNIPPTPCSGDLGLANAGLFVSGTATYLGLINAAQSRLQDVSCNLSLATHLLTTSIAGQMVSADGDTLFYTGNDEIDVLNLLTGSTDPGTITGTWTFTGGTGRFEGATGSFSISGPVNFATASFSGTGVGTITF